MFWLLPFLPEGNDERIFHWHVLSFHSLVQFKGVKLMTEIVFTLEPGSPSLKKSQKKIIYG